MAIKDTSKWAVLYDIINFCFMFNDHMDTGYPANLSFNGLGVFDMFYGTTSMIYTFPSCVHLPICGLKFHP